MTDLGPCPLCGGIVKHMCDDEGVDYIDCYTDGCPYVVSDNADTYHNRLSAMGELWRLLKWAKTTGLHVYITAEDEVGVQGPYSATFVSESSTLLEALREAQKALEDTNET